MPAHVGGIVSFLFLGGACSDFCSLGWVVMACRLLLAVSVRPQPKPRLLLAVWLVLAMWAGLTGSVWLATVVVLAMRSM